MKKGTIRIGDIASMHLRPATKLGKIACQYQCSIKLVSGNTSANAKSIISLLGAWVKFGEEIELICDGVDEDEAYEAIKQGLESFQSVENLNLDIKS